MSKARKGFTPTDTEMLDWLEAAHGVDIHSSNTTWATPSGNTFVAKFLLSAKGTRYAPCETLRETIREAMAIDGVV